MKRSEIHGSRWSSLANPGFSFAQAGLRFFEGKSGGSLLGCGLDLAGSSADSADDSIAALAHAAGTATPRAVFLHGLGNAVIVDRKAVSECHF
jgi:hypothetical protein